MKQMKQKIILMGILFILAGSYIAINRANGYGYPSEMLVVGPKTALVPYWEYLDNFSIEADMAVGPTGTVSLVWSGTWEEEHKVYYMDNATGTWSEAEELVDPTYVNYEANDIFVDNNGDVHIYANGATFVQYITNKTADGSWYKENIGSAFLSFGITGNSDGSKIYTIAYEDNAIIYQNLSLADVVDPLDGETLNWSKQSFSFDESDPYYNVFFPNLAINSTGDAHIVFQANNSIYYFTISPLGVSTLPREISDKPPINGSKCEYPVIKIDSADKIHLIYNKIYQLENGSWDLENSGLYYDEINATTDGSDAYKIAPVTYSPKMTIDKNDHILVLSTLTENEIQQIQYTTNRGGDWTTKTLTDFSYSIYAQGEGIHEICVNPETDDVLLLTRYKGRMELIQTKNGEWGHEVEYTITLSTFETEYPDNVLVSLKMKNLESDEFNFAMDAGVESDGEPEFVNTDGRLQTIGILAADATVTKNWELHYPSAYDGQIHVGLFIDPNLDDRSYFGVYYDIKITTKSIPGPSVGMLLLAFGFGIGIILIIKRKR
ncbi:MAG: hypothetical protein ACTSWX_09845 [Promethearchaeota archaeon]